MIRLDRAATIQPGKTALAIAYAKDMASYFEARSSGSIRIFLQLGGVAGRMCWQSEHDDMGEFVKTMGSLLADADYQAMVAKGADLFIAGDTTDTIWVEI